MLCVHSTFDDDRANRANVCSQQPTSLILLPLLFLTTPRLRHFHYDIQANGSLTVIAVFQAL